MQVLSAHAHHPDALGVLGMVLYSQGRHEDAARVFNALTLMQPTAAEHWQNLATALRPTGRHDQALAAFERALQLAGPSGALLYNLGMLQMERCNYDAAYLSLRDAVRLAPANAMFHWAFAQCCYDLLKTEEGLAALEGWPAWEGLTVEMTARIVLLLVMLGASQQAWPGVERLLADPPRTGRAALMLASLLERLHRLDEARSLVGGLECNDRSLDEDPERLALSALLASRSGQHAEAVQYLERALPNQTEFVHRHHLLFQVAKEYDAVGRYEEAYAAAGEAQRSKLAFLEATTGKSTAEDSEIWTLTGNGCDADDVATWHGSEPSVEDSPIFIVGFPRSGTTLLEQVLDAHPRLKSMDEQPFLRRCLPQVADLGAHYPAQLGNLTPKALDDIRAGYWERVRKKVQLLPGQRLVDKAPFNLVLLPLMRRLFPHARMVVAIRHPCDTLLSCFLQDFRAPDLALLCTELTTLAKAYARCFGFWYSQWPLLQPSSYELRYEQLASDFETEVRKLSAFLELPWDEAMLAPGEHARKKGFISTPSYHQVVQPISTRSVGRWQHYKSHFTASSSVLMPWLERWDYSADFSD